MLILALDSTATVGSVALCRDDVPLACFTVKNGNTHSETLLPMVEAVLRSAGVRATDVDLFACSTGPGSFTGVRIGTATVKGLAFSREVCCLGVSTLEALATNAIPTTALICPVMNARRGQLYNALFRFENGTLVRETPDRAIAATELDEVLAKDGRPYLLVGDGVEEFLRHATKTAPEAISPLLVDQCATSVAKVAYARFLAGERGKDTDLNPTYLRMPQAERERLERLQEQAP